MIRAIDGYKMKGELVAHIAHDKKSYSKSSFDMKWYVRFYDRGETLYLKVNDKTNSELEKEYKKQLLKEIEEL